MSDNYCSSANTWRVWQCWLACRCTIRQYSNSGKICSISNRLLLKPRWIWFKWIGIDWEHFAHFQKNWNISSHAKQTVIFHVKLRKLRTVEMKFTGPVNVKWNATRVREKANLMLLTQATRHFYFVLFSFHLVLFCVWKISHVKTVPTVSTLLEAQDVFLSSSWHFSPKIQNRCNDWWNNQQKQPTCCFYFFHPAVQGPVFLMTYQIYIMVCRDCYVIPFIKWGKK